MVQMPALNTPQFGWVKSRLKHKAQPVPPIFQPEVGARAIYWAAHHARREMYVGWPTVEAIVGNKLAPGLLDRYLGKTGFASQQTCEPEDPNRPDNLWEPLKGDHGAHGTFEQLRTQNQLGTTGEPWSQMDRSGSGGNRSGRLARFEARVRISLGPFASTLFAIGDLSTVPSFHNRTR